ncbi:hypothetical protein CBR71_14130 [Bordetella hinzii]|nr:hypothetical protein CBR70_13865 [Bordetella hinzii]QDJ46867.1 hypothetical protein CBR71_14130 [Bordetella hinzii]QDJ55779.1 hypothetical protein CBR72_13560 [Bordetella hinzii]
MAARGAGPGHPQWPALGGRGQSLAPARYRGRIKPLLADTGTSGAFQAVVRAGNWFGAERADPVGYALVGCTVAPGFEFSEFELADTAALLRAYAAHEARVRRLGPGR